MKEFIKKLIAKIFKKPYCELFGHDNNISVVNEVGIYLCDKCERCGEELPIGYPFHAQYKTLTRGQE
jgi:hypothetical protein